MIKSTNNSNLAPATVWEYVDAFESALRQSDEVHPRDFFPSGESPIFEEVVTEILRIKLEFDWSVGKQNSLDDIIGQHPELASQRQIMSLVAYEDFRQRRIHKVDINPELYRKRFGIQADGWMEGWEADSNHHEHGLDDPDSPDSIGSPSPCPVNPGETDHRHAATTDAGGQAGGANSVQSRNVFPEPGEHFDKFEIVAELGRGAFGRVYVSRQPDLANRLIALKITAMPLGESQRLAKLQHAHIMPIHSLHQSNGMFALCMPLFGTATLKDVVDDFVMEQTTDPANRDSGSSNSRTCFQTSGRHFAATIERQQDRLPESVRPEACINSSENDIQFGKSDSELLIERYPQWSHVESVLQIGLQLAEGLHHAHSRGILHRDIKPANVLLSDDGTPLLLDFNLSRDDQRLPGFATHSIGGTLPYMAPEHIRSMLTGDDSITLRTDIYSLGVVLYQLLTGRLPHDLSVDCVHDLGAAIELRQQPLKPPRELNPSISPAEQAIVLKCISNDPMDRYASAADLAVDLRNHLNHRPLTHAGNPSLKERLIKYSRRHPKLVSVSTMVMISLPLIFAALYYALQFRIENLRHESVEIYEDFIKSVHRAEAELLFPDGGSHSTGLQRGQDALAHYRVLDDDRWQESAEFTYLPDQEKNLARQHVNHLLSLMDAAAGPDVPSRDFERKIREGEAISAYRDKAPLQPARDEPLMAATDLYHRQNYVAAIEMIDRAIDEAPDRFALWFLMGKCHYELREYRQADHCYALAALTDQQSAMCALGRALCNYWLNQDDEALSQLAKAETIDPGINAIYVNRALIYERQKKYPKALTELNKALNRDPDAARYLMARSRVLRLAGDIQGADADLERIKQVEPSDPESWLMKGIARLSESPDAALEDFRRASAWPTMAAVARQNMAHVLSEHLKRPDEAIHVLAELLDDQPDFLPAIAGRAVLHARLGNRDRALADVKRCLKLDPSPQIQYQIACVYALLSQAGNDHGNVAANGPPDEKLIERSLHHLSIALMPAYGSQVIATDNDLRPLEKSEAFRSLKQGVQTVNQHAE